MDIGTSLTQQFPNILNGDRIRRCLQCGTCTGSCPASYIMDLTPREVIALIRANEWEPIFASRTIWICASSYACTVRCPQNVPVTDIMYLLKRVAIEQKMFPKRFPVYVLSRSFVALANRYGRSYEPGLVLMYYLRSNPLKLLGMIPLFLRLILKGRVGLIPKTIQATDALSKILAEAEIMEMIVPITESKS